MSEKTTELDQKVFMQTLLCDYDYLSSRLLFHNGFFVTAARLSGEAIERYAKAFLWSVRRTDLIKEIKSFGGTKSHDIVFILNQMIEKAGFEISLSEKEVEILRQVHNSYKSRFSDIVVDQKISTSIGLSDLGTIDRIVNVIRNRIELHPTYQRKTILDLLQSDPKAARAITMGMSDAKWILEYQNKHLSLANSHSVL